MALRFIDFETSESKNPPKADKFQRVASIRSVFFIKFSESLFLPIIGRKYTQEGKQCVACQPPI
jgi:hypothetical protein